MRVRTTVAVALVAVSALVAWPPARRWLADVLAVTARHLDHGPDVEPPPGAIERGRRRMARAIADALVERGQAEAADAHRGATNGRQPI